MKDYYYILGIGKDATNTEIKNAYRKLSIKFHPDKNDGDKFFEERFKDTNEAYEILINEQKRSEYDHFLKLFNNTATKPNIDSNNSSYQTKEENFSNEYVEEKVKSAVGGEGELSISKTIILGINACIFLFFLLKPEILIIDQYYWEGRFEYQYSMIALSLLGIAGIANLATILFNTKKLLLVTVILISIIYFVGIFYFPYNYISPKSDKEFELNQEALYYSLGIIVLYLFLLYRNMQIKRAVRNFRSQ